MGERNLVLFVIAACALSAVHAMLKPDDMGRKKYDHAVHRLTMEKWRGWREKNPEVRECALMRCAMAPAEARTRHVS